MTADNEFPDIDYRAAANLMAHPVAGLAAVSAIGFGVAGHMMGLVAGTMAGAMNASRRSSGTNYDGVDPMSAFLNWTKFPETVAEPTDFEPDEPQEEKATAKSVASGESADAMIAAEAVSVQPRAMPRPDMIDDLKQISGIGPKLEQVLHGLGIWTFEQISLWTPSEIKWVDEYLQFKGRIDRDGWIAQATAMSAKNGGVS